MSVQEQCSKFLISLTHLFEPPDGQVTAATEYLSDLSIIARTLEGESLMVLEW
jgi:hypothetical protein